MTGLRLGGIEIPGAPRLHGHSDGDAALHAIAGALLGAAGLGDLGAIFPADERTPRGIASSDLLEGVIGRLADAGWHPAIVDLTIDAGRPWIGPSMPAMRERDRGAARAGPGEVSVKASTGNLSGDVGAGRVISAQALATVARTGRRRRMMLRLQDTLSGETRELEPLEPGHVRIYSCGPTVYGPTHIGNFRSFLFADVLVRYLRYRGLRVTWVMNITDVDDKIIARRHCGGRVDRGARPIAGSSASSRTPRRCG